MHPTLLTQKRNGGAGRDLRSLQLEGPNGSPEESSISETLA